MRRREKAKAYCDSLNIEYRIEAVRESIINQKVPKRYEDNFRCAFLPRECQARDADFALGQELRLESECLLPWTRYEAHIRTSRQQRRGAGLVRDVVFAERSCACVRLRAGVCVREQVGGR